MALPDPLLPPYIDLRVFDDMPLDVVRLANSDIVVDASDAGFKAAVLLWARSWHQIPAGSLPDDDAKLANMAGYGKGVRGWRKVRDEALRGFILCSDNRLYHHVICEKAKVAWGRRMTGKNGAQARWDKPKPLKTPQSPDADAYPPAYAGSDAKTHADAMPGGEWNGEEVVRTRSESVDRPSPPTNTESAESIAQRTKKDALLAFDALWAIVPRKKAKADARKAYLQALTKTDPQTIMEGMKRYAAERSGQDAQFTAYPASWLRDECWNDEPDAVGDGPQRRQSNGNHGGPPSITTALRELLAADGYDHGEQRVEIHRVETAAPRRRPGPLTGPDPGETIVDADESA